MKKYVLYIIIFAVAALVSLFLLNNNNAYRPHRFDGRVTLRQKDKIPYGTYVAYENLKYIFPKARIFIDGNEPGYWDSLSNYNSGQAVIIVTPQLMADENEMKKLIDFVQKGNDVFISTRIVSYKAQEILKCKTRFSAFTELSTAEELDTLRLSLEKPPFLYSSSTTYPGKGYDSYFYKYDSAITYVMGRNEEGFANFIRLRTGSGNLYLHLAPLAFSNYFVLHKSNMAYYNNVFSVISPGVKKIVWDEYFLRKLFDSQGNKKKGLLGVLFEYPSLKWGVLTAFFALLLYVLLEMRRKQRIIPLIQKPANESLDFVKTIGRLYYEKGDHKNLSRKMAAYFLEHIRNKYKLTTNSPDEAFIKAVHFKSGYAEKELREIISFINFIETAPAISDAQLNKFHKQLEAFYRV